MAAAQANHRGGMEPRRRFRILKELAEGAFGKVYLAEMITGDNFKSVVAIKLLHGKWVGHEEIVQRSRDEARVLGLLHHRNIVRVEDLTSINGQCAIIMEYLEGVDLKSLIRFCLDNQSQVPRKVAFEIAASAATALDAAYHRKTLNSGQPLELIHRDIKPSNVMVTVAGEVKVLDFGTARAQFEHREAETQALAFGSAAYMAPERMMGDPDGPAGDVFSLGVTLYELLAMKGFGKIFIRGEKFDESLNERVDALDLSELGQARATQVRQVLRLMLAYEPDERPSAQQVVELMEALAEEIQDGSIRRFCREIVKPAHETLDHSGNPNDPFTGSTLFEDSSRVRDEAIEEVEKRVTVDIDPVETGVEYISDVLGSEGAPADASTMERLDTGHGEFEHTDVAVDGYPLELKPADPVGSADPQPPSGGPEPSDAPQASTGGGGLLGLAVIGLLLGVGVLYGIYTVLIPEEPVSVETISDAPKYLPGGRIETGQGGGKGGDMAVNLTGLGSAKVTISGGTNSYIFRWDGTDTLELIDLDPGAYRLRFRTSNTTEVLEARVESGRTCAYRYNLESEGDEWDASGC
jgi:serine/threonine protein kinase